MSKNTYEVKSELNVVIWTNSEGVVSSIPINESNSDYQRYLRWLENPEAEENGTISQEYGETLQSWNSVERAAGR